MLLKLAALGALGYVGYRYYEKNRRDENGVAFAECVKEGTGGALEIVVHPNGSLFSGNDIKRAIQTGQAPIGERLLSAHANENPIFGFDSIPFLATSFDDSDKLAAAAHEALVAALDEQNLVYVYSVPWPPQGFYFKKEVNSVADMAGVKFRAYNAATTRIAQLVGAQPLTIQAAELSQALATGVVDSFMTSGATGVDSKVWESLTHFASADAWLPKNMEADWSVRISTGLSFSSWNILVCATWVRAVTRQSMVRTSSPGW